MENDKMEELIRAYDEGFKKWAEPKVREYECVTGDSNVFLLHKLESGHYFLRGFEVQVSKHYDLKHLLIYYTKFNEPIRQLCWESNFNGGGRWKIDEATKTLRIYDESGDYGPVGDEKAVEKLAENLKGILNIEKIIFDLGGSQEQRKRDRWRYTTHAYGWIKGE